MVRGDDVRHGGGCAGCGGVGVMSMRERLLELIDESRVTNNEHCVCINGSAHIADHIKNGYKVYVDGKLYKPKEKKQG